MTTRRQTRTTRTSVYIVLEGDAGATLKAFNKAVSEIRDASLTGERVHYMVEEKSPKVVGVVRIEPSPK